MKRVISVTDDGYILLHRIGYTEANPDHGPMRDGDIVLGCFHRDGWKDKADATEIANWINSELSKGRETT